VVWNLNKCTRFARNIQFPENGDWNSDKHMFFWLNMIIWIWQHIWVICLCKDRCSSSLERFLLIKLKFVKAFSLVLPLAFVPDSFDLYIWSQCMQNRLMNIMHKTPQNRKLYCLAYLKLWTLKEWVIPDITKDNFLHLSTML